MRTSLEPQPHHQMMHRKMKDSFTPVYLTVLSVIQAVAMADLASVVANGYTQLTSVQWLQAAITFATLIIVWDAFTQVSILWEWVPDIRDSAIPFVIGALELFLIHTIVLSLSGWLFASALLSGMATLANWHTTRQASKEAENAAMSGLLWRQARFIVLSAGLSALFLLLAVVSQVASLDASQDIQGFRGALSLGFVLLVSVGLGAIEVVSVRSWRQIVDYTRTGQTPPGARASQS